MINKDCHMEEDRSDTKEQDLSEEEKALKKEESAKKLKVILFFVLPVLISFLILTHYVLQAIEANKIT